MKKSKDKIIWGVILLLVAVGIMLVAFMPELAFLNIKTWKWFLGIVLLYWLLKNLLFGYGIAGHLSIFIQLALMAMLFESDIARFINKPEDWFNNWLVLGSAVLLTIAVNLIFRNSFKKKDSVLRFGSSSTQYFDFTRARSYSVKNTLGETEVFCQNLDSPEAKDDLSINVQNKLGETTVHVPADCIVDSRIENSLGDVSVRPNTSNVGKKIVVNGKNKLGDIRIVSP